MIFLTNDKLSKVPLNVNSEKKFEINQKGFRYAQSLLIDLTEQRTIINIIYEEEK